MTVCNKKNATILHFGSDRPALLLRALSLTRMGYDVLNASNGFEAIHLASLEIVDAVVIDQNRDCEEVDLIVTEIKRFRPQLPTILLAEQLGILRRAQELADAWVRRENLTMLGAALRDALYRQGRAVSASGKRISR